MTRKLILSIFGLLLLNISLAQNIIFVDALATGNNQGTSWTNAYPDLQLALEAAQFGDEIWVAKATYFPSKDTAGDTNPAWLRTKTFELVNGVGIYGGFDGTETKRSQRDWRNNLTVLSGGWFFYSVSPMKVMD